MLGIPKDVKAPLFGNDQNLYYTLNEDVIVKELAPSVFSYLRRLDEITDEEIRESLNPEKNLSAIFKAGES
jgi:hypothetical protein